MTRDPVAEAARLRAIHSGGPNTQLAMLARSRRPKKHSHWFVEKVGFDANGVARPLWEVCDFPGCGITRADYEARQKRGRTSRARGLRIQRERNRGLGIRNLAGNNPNLDGASELFATEQKSGGAFSERYWRWLKGVKLITSQQVPILIVTDTPGAGRRARSIVIVDYDDWKELHGE